MKASMLARNDAPGFSVLLKRFLFAAALAACLLPGTSARAQQPDPASRPDHGLKPVGSYSLSDIENISLVNGNVSLSIPLASLPPIAGGKLSWTVAAHYNSKNWDQASEEFAPDTNHGGQFWNEQFISVSSTGGWSPVAGQYGIFQTAATDDFSPADPGCTGGLACLENSYNFKLFLVDPDGARHELRPADFSSGDASDISWRIGFYNVTPQTSGSAMRYYSFDGSYIWASIDPYTGGPSSWTVVLKDGTRVHQASNGIQTITDPNGNQIKIFTENISGITKTHYQDLQATGSITREIVVTFDSANNAGTVQYYGPTGVLQTFNIQYGTTHVDQLVNVGDRFCNSVLALIGEDLFVIRSITLPQTEPNQTRKFTFAYNSDASEDTINLSWIGSCTGPTMTQTSVSHGWGSLSEMDLPSGAQVLYSFNLDGDSSPVRAFKGAREVAREHITQKRIKHDGGTEDDWNFNIVPGTGTVTGPDGSSTTETSYPHDLGQPQVNGDLDGRGGLVYRTNKSGVEMVERHWVVPLFSGADSRAPNGMANFNPVVDAEYTSMLDGSGNPLQMSAKTYQIDYNGNVLDEKDYDWFDPSHVTRDSNGVPMAVPSQATLLREIANTYYNSPGTSAGSTLVYAKRDLATASPKILNALEESIVKLGTTTSSDRQLSYDNNAFGAAPTTAGNLTEDDRLDSHSGLFIKTLHSYDTLGNILTTTDPNGNVTTYAYTDLTHALPTSVTVDPLNTTGTQVTNLVYDYYTGLVISKQDPAGNTTTTSYTNQLLTLHPTSPIVDPFGRPGVVTYPAVTSTVNGQATANQQRTVVTSYYDVTHRVAITSDLNANADGLLNTRGTSDQLGRPVLSETSENGTATSYSISSQTVYLQAGRIMLTSNPARSTSATTDGWSRTTKDTAGRVLEVATFSGSAQPPQTGTNTNWTGSVSTTYSGNQTLLTDQSGAERITQGDGLGRLTDVWEITAHDSATVHVSFPGHAEITDGYHTSYGYDPLGNLTSVSQGSQGRTFTYDSLSRLRSAYNPEQVNTSGAQVATIYDYDNNGNLKSKQNPAGTSVTYQYDGLNRVSKKTLGAGPVFDYAYDTTSVGKGRLASVKLDATVGQQQQGDGYVYDAYDALSRPTSAHQVTGGVSYQFAYGYDLAGDMTSEQYPSLRTVTTTFDDAARVNGVSGKLGSVTTTYASSFTYAAPGETTAMQLGGTGINLWVNASYNSRLQPTKMGAGTASADYSKLELDYAYGVLVNQTLDPTKNNGNVQNQTIKIPGATFTQSYTYDSLNRLTVAQEPGGTNPWNQTFIYDRYANRNFDAANTTPNVLGPNPAINQTTNRFSNGQGYSYDTSGNLSAEPGKTYSYDAENHLVNFNNGVASYAYDGDGRRVIGASGTVFVYDVQGRLIAEYGGPQGTNSGTSYLIADHLSSTRLVTDSQGNVRARHDYLPFGEELQAGIGGRTMAQGYNAQDDTRQRFTSKERDTESGLDFVEARYYTSIQGRFTSTDPMMISGDRLMDPQEINLYNYARNNPLRFSDPTGEDINDSALDENKDYQKWKKALLSTEAGRAQWDKYANDHSVTITITMGENAGGNFGAETTPTFDESGKFTGATIVLGTDFAKRDTLDAEAYPISSKMTEGGDPGITSVDRTARAVDFLAHEFGHVEDAQKRGKDVLERENQLLAKNQQLEQKFGPQFGKTAQYAALQSQCGCNNVSDLHTQREVRAEAAVIPVMRDYYAKGAGHGSMPSRVNQAIQNYQKAHP